MLLTSNPVMAIESSSMTECATLDKTNDKCVSQYESCGYFLIKKGEKASDRDQFDYRCIMTKFCNSEGTYNDVITHFSCPYGRKDPKLEAARKTIKTETAKKAIEKSEQYTDHIFGEECEDNRDLSNIIPGAELSAKCKHRTAVIPE